MSHKKIVLFVLFTLFITTEFAIAQTGIGTTTPDASAKLEVSATNKGFLPPRVALTATNVASPITNPANGLMVFNTVTAGTNPFQVVPGYYYWDATGLKWMSLSTTVGNVQNQAIFRSTSNTAAGSAVSTWNSRFNNIASGDLTVTSNTTFALSNGIYKIQWGLPHQQTQTYNTMHLQENTSGTWNSWLNDANYATVANGGNTDWGGTSFMTDIVDCSANTRTFRLLNGDGSRTLFYGASFTITKLNAAISTSTTADNLGNHTATKNINLSGNYISNDGGNEGLKLDNAGNVGINTATPSQALDVTGNVKTSGNYMYTDGSSTAKKVSGYVNAGTFISFENIQVTVTTSGTRGLSVAAVSTPFYCNIGATYAAYGGGNGNAAYNSYITTTASGSLFGWHFTNAGDYVTYLVNDTTNNRVYRITMSIGAGYVNNFISIERLN